MMQKWRNSAKKSKFNFSAKLKPVNSKWSGLKPQNNNLEENPAFGRKKKEKNDDRHKGKKSFNKEIKIYKNDYKERQNKKKEIYNSFINDSIILEKPNKTEKNKKNVNTDCWDYYNEKEKIRMQEFEKWKKREIEDYRWMMNCDELDKDWKDVNLSVCKQKLNELYLEQFKIIEKNDKKFNDHDYVDPATTEYYIISKLYHAVIIDVEHIQLAFDLFKLSKLSTMLFCRKYNLNHLIEMKNDVLVKNFKKFRKKYYNNKNNKNLNIIIDKYKKKEVLSKQEENTYINYLDNTFRLFQLIYFNREFLNNKNIFNISNL